MQALPAVLSEALCGGHIMTVLVYLPVLHKLYLFSAVSVILGIHSRLTVVISLYLEFLSLNERNLNP